MDPVGARLSELGGFQVTKLDVVAGDEAEQAVAEADPGEVILLENTRFEPGETKNDPALSERLARLGELFVLDAFGSAHRAHASTVGVAEHVRSVGGPLLLAEVEAFGRLLGSPDAPYVVVLGGAKVSDKLGVIGSLLPKVDRLLIGGGMCFTLLAAQGREVGDSLLEPDRIEEVRAILDGENGSKIVLPSDLVVADRPEEGAAPSVVGIEGLAPGNGRARHRADHRRSVCLRDRHRCHGLLEWPDGRIRVGAVFRGNPASSRVDGRPPWVTPWWVGGTRLPPCGNSGWRRRSPISPLGEGQGSRCSRAPPSLGWPHCSDGRADGPQTAHRRQLEDACHAPRGDPDGAEAQLPARSRLLRAGRCCGLPTGDGAPLGADGDRDRPHEHPPRSAGLPLGGEGGLHRRDIAVDVGQARRGLCHRRPLRAAPALRRDRRDGQPQGEGDPGPFHDPHHVCR